MPEFQLIGWVGVFGTFSRGKQTAKSDIDFLVGFKEGTSDKQVYYMADLEEHLSQAMQREVDILYMHTREPLNFVKAQALLTGKTIYEVDAWLYDNRSLAKKLMVDTHRRLNAAVLLADDIYQQAAMMKKEEDTAGLEELIYSVTKLMHHLSPQDPDAEYLNSFFDPVYCWTTAASGILKKCERGFSSFNDKDQQLLLQALTDTLPGQMRILKKLYLPVLQDVLDHVHVRHDGH
ncbi:hypothetical protein AJ79_05700 [Helicocarpus griseus UAMH5409]|uniref:Polymerase beta nucleotidyltransferase domain-containing protein n=1 Tax=Helicocarpus griseus UAMH5409 TaxID=1447875 RepID=A0A2B7XLB7_9EURO|nr:hypothetical protein AJ79_05700 [Helicocarpus griseus UAMH5409]